MKADRRLCLTADRSRVVEEDDPQSAWLLVGEGRTIGAGDIERYGLSLVDGRVVVGAKQSAKPEDKQAPQPEDKSVAVDTADVTDGDGLPDDIPAREELIAAGITTLAAVAAIEDLTALPGIGKATDRKIRAYLAEGAE